MQEITNIGPEFLESLRKSLTAVPDTHLVGNSREAGMSSRLRPDVILDAIVANREFAFVVETRGDVFPRDAREIVWQLTLEDNMQGHPTQGE